MSRSRIKVIAPAVAAVLSVAGLAALTLVGCEKPAAVVAEAPPPAVNVAAPVVQEIVEQDDYTGRLGSVEAVDVRARVSGYVDSIHFTDGQLVNKGDLLFVIDPRPFAAALQIAEGEVREAQSRRELANNDFDRAKTLVSTRAISTQEFDTLQKTAEAAAAAVETAQARVTRAKLDLEFTHVRSPMSGRIARHLVSVGNLITGGAANSDVLTNIVSVNPVYAYFDIDEQAYLKYQRLSGGSATRVFQDASVVQMSVLGETKSFAHTGKLNFVDNQIDPVTGTLRARAVFDNSGLKLVPGVFVKIRLAGSAPRKAVLVPDRAVQADQSDRFVYVVDGKNVVSQRRITPGRLHDGLRIVTAGLDGSESVIVDGIQRARAGATVAPEATTIAFHSATTRPTEQAALTHPQQDGLQ